MKRLAALLIVVAGGCVGRPDPAVHVTWGGQNGELYGDNSQPSTRQGPIVPCPDWGWPGGPVSSVVVWVYDPSGEWKTIVDCHDGGATIPVAEGSVTVELHEGLNPGYELGMVPGSYTFTANVGMTHELGFVDLDEDLWAPSSGGGGGCDDDDCGGDPDWPF
jgi:hypothetical protein